MAKKSEAKADPVVEPAKVAPTEVAPVDRVFSVEIDRCLLGVKLIRAKDEAEALAKYKAPCGITKHRGTATIRLCDFGPDAVPEGVTLFGG